MMSEWRREPLSKLAEFINGRAFKPEEWGTQGLPIIRIANLNNPDAEFDYYSGTVDDRHLIQHGDLLLSWSASLGAYKWKGENAVLNQHIFKVVPSQYVNKDFLYYLLDRSVEKLKERVHGSTMKHIKKGELDDLQVEVPPLYEQRKIAAILSSVDEAIEKTEAIIEQTDKVKKGLMQQLLTKGIGHTKFKKTEIGEIPEEWEVKQLAEVCVINPTYRIEKGTICSYILFWKKRSWKRWRFEI
jgi:type I restriction enzyme, S subunit